MYASGLEKALALQRANKLIGPDVALPEKLRAALARSDAARGRTGAG